MPETNRGPEPRDRLNADVARLRRERDEARKWAAVWKKAAKHYRFETRNVSRTLNFYLNLLDEMLRLILGDEY